MSSTSSPTLIVEVRSRRAEAAVVVCTIALGVCAPLLLRSLETAATAGLGALTGAILAAGFRRAGWLGGRRRLDFVSWVADGRWLLKDRAGREAEAVLDAQTRVTAHVLWLRWRVQEAPFRTHSILLTWADLPEPDLRRLVVRLRIDGLKRAPSPRIVAA